MLVGAGLFVWYWRRNTRANAATGGRRRSSRPSRQATIRRRSGPRWPAAGNPPLATFFDLAQRGVLRIEETPQRWGQHFTLYRQPPVIHSGRTNKACSPPIFESKDGLSDSLPLSKRSQPAGLAQKAVPSALGR